MATLIKSKQIQGVVTASVIEGIFTVSGSLVATDITASGNIRANTFTGNGGGLTNINFGSIVNAPTLVSGSSQIVGILTDLNTFSGSQNTKNATLATYTASVNSQLTNLTQATSSYETKGRGIISSSAQISALGYVVGGGGGGTSDYTQLTNVPNGIISGSSQITALGFVSASATIPTGTISSSAQITALGFVSSSDSVPAGTISGSSQLTASFDTRYTLSGSVQNVTLPSNIVSGSSQISYTGLSNIPAGIISSSQQLPQGLVSGSSQVLGGSGIYSGSIPNLSSLNTFTQSIDSRVDNLENATGSYLTSLNGAISSSSQVVLGDVIGFTTYSSSIDSRIDNISVSSTPAGTISSSAQITALGFISESTGDITYNGDRIVSNTLLGDLFTNSYNAGTTGSIQDFLNKVFFPNTSPVITSVSYSLNEFSSSGVIGTILATDTEGHSLTFRTGSTYTNGYFSVASNGTLSVTQKALKSWNTNTDVVVAGAHPIPIVVEDTIGATGSAIIYVRVTPNQAPKFRETSTSGVVITSVSSNLNENSTNGTLVKRVYFTDTENDNLTITSSSIDNNHFVVTKYSTYVDITQNTSSLDYEQQAQYNFSITASDSKYGSGDDLFATASLPIVVNVTDNITPTLSNQTLSSINENSANGATVGTISATDAEGDTKTFLNFELHRLELDNVLVPSGSYNGTSQLTDPHENPFQMNSSGTITRKTGVYINSDLINEYQYRVQVVDNFNANSNVAIITIPITDDTAPSLTTNGTFYIVESAVSGSLIRTNSNGFSGTQGDMNSNQTVSWSSSNNRVAINSNGNLSIGQDVSGSYTSGQTFTSTITATNTFGTTNTSTITLNVVANGAPSISYSNASLNTDTAISGAVISNVTISDQETDVPYQFSLSGTDSGKFNVVPQNANSSSWQIQATGSLEAGTYSVSGSAIDNFGKTTSTGTTFVVATANDYGAVYVYTNNRGASSLNAGNYLGVMAGSYSVSGTTPPEVTAWTTGTPFDKIASNLGDSTIDVSAGVTTYTMYKEAVGSGSYLNTVLAGIGQFNGQPTGQEQVIVIFPSGSDMMGIPTSMTTGFGGSTTGEYVLNLQYDGNGWTNTIESSTVNLITLDSAHLGYTKWYVAGRTTANAANNYQIRITPSSGSAPS